MDGRDSLLTAVLETPADDTARLVLADLLRESEAEEERALGRFVWAGVTAAGFRGDGVIEDSLYYAAQKEIAAVASAGYPARWLASLGVGPVPLTERDWGWDSTFDRVTVRVGGVAGVFTRGMLAELSLPLGEWYAVAPAALASWPLELATVTDVPGLTFAIDAAGGWRLAARLRVPGTWTDNQLDGHRVSFDDRLLELVRRPRAVPEYATLARHLWDHFEQWFAFVFDPRIEPTNWKAEQAIRPAVVNRKVWGGNRTDAGSRTQGVLMSVFETCRRQALSAVDHVSQTLRWFGNRLLPRPMLLPGR